MKKTIKISMLGIMLLTSVITFGQHKKKSSKSTKYQDFEYTGYDRKAFSVLYLNNLNDKDSKKIGENFSFNYEDFTKRYDYNQISKVKLDGNFETKSDILLSALNNQKVPNKIMDYVMDDGDWSMPLEKLNKRATANKSDAERQLFEKTFAGKNINDLASDFYDDINPVIQSNYIILISAGNVRTYKEIYDEQDKNERERVNNYNKNLKSGEGRIEFKPVQRKNEGYVADLKYWVYNIDIKSDTLLHIFWNNCFSDASFRNAYNYSLRLVTTGTNSIESSQGIDADPKYKVSMSELYKDILRGGDVNNILANTLPEHNEFKIMLSVYENNPISLKIGSVEELKKDSRYFVYVKEQNKNQKVRWKRQGVIRAKKVTKNNDEKIQDSENGIMINDKNLAYIYTTKSKNDTAKTWVLQGRYIQDAKIEISNNKTKNEITVKRGLNEQGMMIPSTFYQTEGGKIEGYGTMLAIESPSWNLFVSPSFGTSGLDLDLSYLGGGFQYFLNFNFSGYKSKDFPEIDYNGTTLKTNVSLFSVHFGVAKDFYFIRNAFFAPHISLGAELAQFSEKKLEELAKSTYGDSYGMSNTTFNVGAKLGYTFLHKKKIFTGVDYFPISYKNNEAFGTNGSFFEIKRSPIRIYVGLRFEI